MKHEQAKKYLARAEQSGYVRYHSGIVAFEESGQVTNYGINIDGDGRDGRLFGCPQIIWSAEESEEKFPKK